MPRSQNYNQDLITQLGLGNLIEQFKQGIAPSRPWDNITDFVTHESFMHRRLYPKQLTLMKLIFLETENMTAFDLDVIESWRESFGHGTSAGVQPDIWDRVDYLKSNGYRRFPHVQAVMGRRGSKGMIGGTLGAEAAAYLISLDNPQEHYGLDKDKDLYLQCVATNLPQAKQNQFADVRSSIESCAYLRRYIVTSKDHLIHLRTPADLRNLAELIRMRVPIEHEIASIRCEAMTSTSTSGRGQASFAVYLDEMAHMNVGTEGPRESSQVYNAYLPSLQQIDKDWLMYMPSSPFSKIGQFFELYTTGSVLMPTYTGEGRIEPGKLWTPKDFEDDPEETFEDLTSDPTMLIFQGPSWMLYEDWEEAPRLYDYSFKRAVISYDTGMKRIERRDPAKFKVEFQGQFAEVENPYLDPDNVHRMFDPFWNGRVLLPQSRGRLDVEYHGHADPGATKAHFAVCIGHVEVAPEPDEFGTFWPNVIIDYLNVWKAKDSKDGKSIDYLQVGNDLDQLLAQFPSLKTFTMDQWNSKSLLANLNAKYGSRTRIFEDTFSLPYKRKISEVFQTALNLGWVHCLAGETRVITDKGRVPIRELSGGTHKVLTPGQANGRGGGKWVDATFRPFGKQELRKITLKRGPVFEQEIFATPEHRWFVSEHLGTGRRRIETTTDGLKVGDKLSYVYAARFKDTVPSPIGIAHGFSVGDGTRTRKGTATRICGKKDEALIPYFAMHKIVDREPGNYEVLNLPRFFKELVDLNESPSYLYGWLAGYVAADGHVNKDGYTCLSSVSVANINHIKAVCDRLGIPCGEVTSQLAGPGAYKPDSVCYRLPIDSQYLTEEFFVIHEHRRRWVAAQSKQKKDYKHWTVISVEPTDRYEEVYCADVPITHSFALDGNILTGNCFRDSFLDASLGGGSLLEQEMLFLIEKNGSAEKLDFGPVTTKDLWDTVSVVTTRLLENHLAVWRNRMMNLPLTSSDAGMTRVIDNQSVATNKFRDNLSVISRRGLIIPQSPARGGWRQTRGR